MLFHVYLRNGIVYVPTVAVREGGPVYTDIEPVGVAVATDAEALRRALLDAIARGNVTLPRPTGAWPAPVLVKHAGVRTWSEFARNTSLWSIEEENGIYQIVGYRRRPGSSWEQDSQQKTPFSHEVTVDLVIDRMIAILQDAAQKRGGKR